MHSTSDRTPRLLEALVVVSGPAGESLQEPRTDSQPLSWSVICYIVDNHILFFFVPCPCSCRLGRRRKIFDSLTHCHESLALLTFWSAQQALREAKEGGVKRL
jgi:hypothetical protein